MEPYIKKSALVAEIERLISNGQVKLQESQESNDDENYVTWSEHIATCIKVLSIIDTLEVKEVDLNAAVEHYVEQHKSELNGYFDIRRIARYFFELGLSTERRIV